MNTSIFSRTMPHDAMEAKSPSELHNNLVDMLKSSNLQDNKASLPFKFNFQFDTTNNEHKGVEKSQPHLPHNSTKTNDQVQNINYKPSDNSFRFNFNM